MIPSLAISDKRPARVLLVAASICIAVLLIPSSTFAVAETTKTTVAIPRDHRLVTRARVPVREGDTWLSILTGLDFASTGAPASRIDPKQVTELVAFSSDAALTQGDWIFVVAVSEAGDSRQVVVGLNLYNHKRRFEIRLDDNGTYSKYSRPRP